MEKDSDIYAGSMVVGSKCLVEEALRRSKELAGGGRGRAGIRKSR